MTRSDCRLNIKAYARGVVRHLEESVPHQEPFGDEEELGRRQHGRAAVQGRYQRLLRVLERGGGVQPTAIVQEEGIQYAQELIY